MMIEHKQTYIQWVSAILTKPNQWTIAMHWKYCHQAE